MELVTCFCGIRDRPLLWSLSVAAHRSQQHTMTPDHQRRWFFQKQTNAQADATISGEVIQSNWAVWIAVLHNMRGNCGSVCWSLNGVRSINCPRFWVGERAAQYNGALFGHRCHTRMALTVVMACYCVGTDLVGRLVTGKGSPSGKPYMNRHTRTYYNNTISQLAHHWLARYRCQHSRRTFLTLLLFMLTVA
jgi:hypothetical protein